MFDDARSKRVVLVAHCLLNQNSISDGTADFPSQYDDVVGLMMDNRIGLIQMPCPELSYLGLDRGDERGSERPLLDENTRIRARLMEREQLGALSRKAETLVSQIQDYRSKGFDVIGVIGVNRSPSCGVETTTRDNAEVPGRGVFIELLSKVLDEREVELPMVGTKTREVETSLERVAQLIQGDL